MSNVLTGVPASGSPVTFSFKLEAKPQTSWGARHAFWFFAMGLGSALYLNHQLFDIELGAFLGMSLAHVLGIVLVSVGGLVLISDLGKPTRAWRALLNPRQSWIAVGAICDFLFLALDGLYVVPNLTLGGSQPFAFLAWGDGWWTLIPHAIAGISAFIIIVYPGLVLSSSPSIPFWNTTLIPLQFLFFAFASALGLALAFAATAGRILPESWLLAEILLLAGSLLMLVAHLMSAYQQRGTSRESAQRLIQGPLAPQLWIGVFLAGVVIPCLLVAMAVQGAVAAAMLMVTLGVLTQVGNLVSKNCVLKAGLYPPIF